ncbi:MAG: NAD(P)/FAD-dependent oxidoreductase [Bacteroidia bacterium]
MSDSIIKTKKYDVAIIGGGLAGLCLAIQLGRKKVKTVLFEKEHYPFHKVCGEYISFESEAFLKELGFDIKKFNLPVIKNLKISAPNGFAINTKLPLGGFGVSRYMLDDFLYKTALKHGVDVFTGCKVGSTKNIFNYTEIYTTHGIFEAEIVCGSWGKRSNLDVQFGRSFIKPKNRNLNNYVGIKYHVVADLPDDLIELHNFKNGYCGISKVEENRYCMCYLVSGNELKKVNGNIKKLEETVLYQNPHLKNYFTRFKRLYSEPLAISQISFEPKETISNNIIMLGDSAGLITPLCGNGMSMAMHASKLLFEELTKYFDKEIDKETLFTNFSKKWKKQFSKRLAVGRIIQQFFGKPVTTNIAIRFLNKMPYVLSKIISLTHGKPF